MIERMKKSRYRKWFGGLLVLYGVVALVTPGIPGAWFIFIGLEFFGIRLLWGEKIKEKWTAWRGKVPRTPAPMPTDPTR